MMAMSLVRPLLNRHWREILLATNAVNWWRSWMLRSFHLTWLPQRFAEFYFLELLRTKIPGWLCLKHLLNFFYNSWDTDFYNLPAWISFSIGQIKAFLWFCRRKSECLDTNHQFDLVIPNHLMCWRWESTRVTLLRSQHIDHKAKQSDAWVGALIIFRFYEGCHHHMCHWQYSVLQSSFNILKEVFFLILFFNSYAVPQIKWWGT